MAWWREMAESNGKCDLHPASPPLECFSTARPITKTPIKISPIACNEHDGTALQEKAATHIQLSWKCFVLRNNLRRQHSAAIRIQSYYRRWLLRKVFLNQKNAVITIQSMLRCIKCFRDFQCYKIATKSAIIIQSIVRGWIARREACRLRYVILTIQVSSSRCLHSPYYMHTIVSSYWIFSSMALHRKMKKKKFLLYNPFICSLCRAALKFFF